VSLLALPIIFSIPNKLSVPVAVLVAYPVAPVNTSVTTSVDTLFKFTVTPASAF
jgi:hypothetical protein